MIWPRYVAVAGMMAVTASMLYLRSATDRVPDSVPLELLPQYVDNRHGTDIPIPDESLQVLGKGRFLNRLYSPEIAGGTPAQAASLPVSLFIGYFPTQRTGQAIHSPQNCLPGSGWTFESSGTTLIAAPDGRRYRVGDYIITDGTNRQEVLYWYRAHGRSIASDYRAKLYMLLDAIRYNRTDGALIRVITPVLPGEPAGAAHARVATFAGDVAHLLPAYIPD